MLHELPTREEREAYHFAQIERLRKCEADGRAAPLALIDYFGDRFGVLQIGGLTGCHFDEYLLRPEVWELLAGAARGKTRATATPVLDESDALSLEPCRLN